MTLARLRLAAAVLLAAPAARAQPAAPDLAFLIGCTEYPNTNLRTLYGPRNDVRLWAEVLTRGFGFPAENVATLVGWDGTEPARRPTAANIRAGFESLIARAGSGSRVVILVSGHGLQVPLPPGADPLDPKNYEPDGLDEVFLPADVGKADADGQLTGAIPDDQFGDWLDALRAKGAHVLIVFDCCHAGTMTRGGADLLPGTREISRVADPAALGITPAQVEAAAARARAAVAAARARGQAVGPERTVRAGGPGSVVAFFAAQPFEEAPELPLPDDAPLRRENYYGLLSFTVLQTLQQRRSVLTYRELSQLVSAHYQATRGARGPVPYAEGDLDREVLGYAVWPNRSPVTLRNEKGKLRVTAGLLAGLTPGSVLAVRARPADAVVGYVRVVAAGPTAAVVEPCAFDRTPVVPADAFADLSPCSLAARDYGDLRVRLFLDPAPDLRAAFGQLAAEYRDMVREVPVERDAEWALRVVAPDAAASRYGLALTAPHVLLVRAEARERDAEAERAAADRLRAAGHPLPRKVFAVYPLPDLTAALDRDLPKLFRWQNVWRVARGLAADRGGEAHGVTLDVVRLKGEKDAGPGEVLRSGAVANGTVLGFRVKNGGTQNVWAVALALDAEMGIDVYEVVAVEAGKTARLPNGVVEKRPGEYGTEGMILFVLPQAAHPDRPDFRFLEQSPLKLPPRGSRGRAPDDPFGRLMEASALRAGTRGAHPVAPTSPAVIVQSWFVTP